MIIDLGALELVIELRHHRKHLTAHLVPGIRPRGWSLGDKFMISIAMDDVSEAFVPILLVDKDGEPLDGNALGAVVSADTDNAEVGVPSQSSDAFGLVVKSVGDAAPNTGVANITNIVVTVPGQDPMPIGETIELSVGVSGAGGATLDSGNVVIRPRS